MKEVVFEAPFPLADARGGKALRLELPATREHKLVPLEIRFADDPEVPFPFRCRQVKVQQAAPPVILSLGRGEKALACSPEGPVWTVGEKDGAKQFRSGFALPEIAPGGALHDLLNERRFLELVPLLDWLRKACKDALFEGPPLRACFIFDDPNLHWPSYGFVDFRQLAAHAARENYHVSFATIPLDSWFTHRATAEIFRRHPGRLSLAVHGNDHVAQELAREYAPEVRVGLLRQAIRRIERLERRAGVPVCRVMVPPYGACSENMLTEMPQCGFEAACLSHGSLRHHNKARAWTREVGYLPSTWVGECPVLPRWGFAAETTNTILLAAFLNQPIVLRGHQEDLKSGVEVLDGLARTINGLGPVLWSRLSDLSRANYQWRNEGGLCRLKPLSRKIVFNAPPGARDLSLEPNFDSPRTAWTICGRGSERFRVEAGEAVPLPDPANGALTVELKASGAPVVENGANGLNVGALVRRLLTEGRDRFAPSYKSN